MRPAPSHPSPVTVLLVVVAVGFAYSMGAHYTGACMGMPHALGAVSERGALLLMAPLALFGAALASHGVERTVGGGLLGGRGLTVAGMVVVIAVALGLTSLFTWRRLPTSTVQILVFSVVGAGEAAGLPVRWAHVATLAVLWVLAPFVAAGLGYLFTRLFDRVAGVRLVPGASGPAGVARALGPGLVAVGALASFTMGANDVANATGSLVGTHVLGPLGAGTLGGLGLAAGVLTWGRPLLSRIAFDVVEVDRPMATAAQLVQALVVLVAVANGYFTSMNQALVGAMAGAGLARGRETVRGSTLAGIVRGWLVGPGAGVVLAYALTRLAVALGGAHSVAAP